MADYAGQDVRLARSALCRFSSVNYTLAKLWRCDERTLSAQLDGLFFIFSL